MSIPAHSPDHQPLFLGPDDVQGLLTMDDAIAAVESGYRDLAEHPVLAAPRSRIHTQAGVRVSTHPGGNEELGLVGVMVHTEAVRLEGLVQHVAAPSPFVYLLFDAQDGRLVCILSAEFRVPELGEVGRNVFRPAAVSGVGVKHLARSDAQVIGVLGSGGQARHHLWMLNYLRTIGRVNVYSPTYDNRERFARDMSALIGIEVHAVDQAELAVRGADIVVVATNTNVPALHGAWLEPGQHVISIVGSNRSLVAGGWASRPRRELDDDVVRRAGLIAVNDRQTVLQDEQADLFEPIQRGYLRSEDLIELGDLATGRSRGRQDAETITLHKNNAGSGAADIALAALVYRKAVELGRGQQL